MSQDKVEASVSLSPLIYHVLVVLSGRTRHAYEILRMVEIAIGKPVAPSTLYRVLADMLDRGLIEEATDFVPEDGGDSNRRYFCLTDHGKKVGSAERKRQLKVAKWVDDDFSTNSAPTPSFA